MVDSIIYCTVNFALATIDHSCRRETRNTIRKHCLSCKGNMGGSKERELSVCLRQDCQDFARPNLVAGLGLSRTRWAGMQTKRKFPLLRERLRSATSNDDNQPHVDNNGLSSYRLYRLRRGQAHRGYHPSAGCFRCSHPFGYRPVCANFAFQRRRIDWLWGSQLLDMREKREIGLTVELQAGSHRYGEEQETALRREREGW